MFLKKVFLKIPENSQENTCARGSFLIKLQVSACNFIKKETLAQVLSCEFSEIFKKTLFHKIPPVAVSAKNMLELLKRHCTPATTSYFIKFFFVKHLPNPKVKLKSRSKVMPVSVFYL